MGEISIEQKLWESCEIEKTERSKELKDLTKRKVERVEKSNEWYEISE